MHLHVKEIRYRLGYLVLSFLLACLSAYSNSSALLFLLVKPLSPYAKEFVFLDVGEAFYTTLNISALAGMCACAPLLLYQIWSFVVPSRFQGERRLINLLFSLSLLLSVGALLSSYLYLLPALSKFLLGFGVEAGGVSLNLQPRISSYVGWSTRLLGTLLLLSQLPPLLIALFYNRISTIASLSRWRRAALILSLLAAALVSPPEVASQSVIALLLFLSYEISVWAGFVLLSVRGGPVES